MPPRRRRSSKVSREKLSFSSLSCPRPLTCFLPPPLRLDDTPAHPRLRGANSLRGSGRYLPRVCKPSYAGAWYPPLLCLAAPAAGGGGEGGGEGAFNGFQETALAPPYPNSVITGSVCVCVCLPKDPISQPCSIGPKQSQRSIHAFLWSRGQRTPHCPTWGPAAG